MESLYLTNPKNTLSFSKQTKQVQPILKQTIRFSS